MFLASYVHVFYALDLNIVFTGAHKHTKIKYFVFVRKYR